MSDDLLKTKCKLIEREYGPSSKQNLTQGPRRISYHNVYVMMYGRQPNHKILLIIIPLAKFRDWIVSITQLQYGNLI